MITGVYKEALVTIVVFAVATFTQTTSLYAYPVGDEFKVNTNVDDPGTGADDHQQLPDAGMDVNGNFVVVFQKNVPLSNATVAARLYDAQGIPAGAEFQVNTFTTLGQARPAAAIDADVNAVVSWQSDQQDGAGEGVFAQRLSGLGVQPTMEFNNDFRADIPWRYGANGSNAIWQMDGFLAQAKQTITGVGDLLWQIVGVGDFNRDGNADFLWRHAGTGQNAIWLMDGLTRTSAASAGVPGPRVVGVDDFNADGKSDIVFRNDIGQNAIWLMDGFTFKGGQLVRGVPDMNWKVEGVRDFDRDVKADILWRHAVSGNNVIWLMDGVTLTAGQSIGRVADTNWSIVP